MKQESRTGAAAPDQWWEDFALKPLARLGRFARAQPGEIRYVAAVIGTCVLTVFHRRFWRRPVLRETGRQVLFLGVEPIVFVCALGALVGISVVVQLAFLTGQVGHAEMLGPLLVGAVARELAPLLISLVVLVRSGSAMTAQLGLLKAAGQVERMERDGGDPVDEIVVPRVLAWSISTFCLTILFIAVALLSGFVFAAWTGKGRGDFTLFADLVAQAIRSRDVLNILAKSILPGLFASTCCCVSGLSVDNLASIPGATRSALTRSVAGLFLTCVTVSLLTYL